MRRDPASTLRASAMLAPLHELETRRARSAAARLSSRQPQGGAGARRARADRREGARTASPSPRRRGWPASARPRPIGIIATATICWPMSRRAASWCSRRRWRGPGTRAGRTPETAFHRLGRAYLAFAHDEPAYLFGDVRGRRVARCEPRAAQRGRSRLPGPARLPPKTLIAELPAEKRPPALMMALHIWSMSHGVAALFGRADAGRRPLPMSAAELLEAGMLIYLKGLGLRPTRPAERRRRKNLAPRRLDKAWQLESRYVNVIYIHTVGAAGRGGWPAACISRCHSVSRGIDADRREA